MLLPQPVSDTFLEPLTLEERLMAVRNAQVGRMVFTTSFGLEDQAVTHAILQNDIDVTIVTLDTGRLHPETYAVWRETEERYARRIKAFYPDAQSIEAYVNDNGIDGFRLSVDARKACCGIRKVAPLARALDGASVWITGLRASQSQARAAVPILAAEGERLKFNPIADWSKDQVAAYVSANAVPYNALHDRGFPSIGCAPCTRAIKVGEDDRAGRWWWENDARKECGLHGSSALVAAIRSAA